MGELYSEIRSTHPDVEPENAIKGWKKYFRSATFINDDDQKWHWGLHWNDDAQGQSRVDYAERYLFAVVRGAIPLDPEIRQILLPLRTEIIELSTRSVQWALDREKSNLGDLKSVDMARKFLRFVESAL